MIIPQTIEKIFSHAVALNQSGRMKNEVYCINKNVFILNSDRTILMRFIQQRYKFEEPISFFANHYDSNQISVDKDRISFKKETAEMIRDKICPVPKDSPSYVEGLFLTRTKDIEKDIVNKVVVNRSILSLLEEGLSHIEFVMEENLRIIQRDIFSGTLIELRRKSNGLNFSTLKDVIKVSLPPVGMRMDDFLALFAFTDSIEFMFSSTNPGFCIAESNRIKMKTIVGLCLYDELGVINYGRKEQEDRNCECAIN